MEDYMRQALSVEKGRSRLLRQRVTAFIAISIAAVLFGGCNQTKGWLYVANTAYPQIHIYSVDLGSNNLPQLQPKPSVTVAAGPPEAIRIVGAMLYMAAGTGAIAQYAINPNDGGLTLQGTITTGSPPYAIASTNKTLYVANRGSGTMSVFSINAGGSLAALQTVGVNDIKTIQVDGSGKFLFAGIGPKGANGPRICAMAIQTDGTLAAGPGNCIAVNGSPESMLYAGNVLYLRIFATTASGIGNSYRISALTVDSITGALSHRGQELDIGAANSDGLAISVDGKFLFLSRQGGFLTMSAADPLRVVANATPISGSQWCAWPPVGAGAVLVDPRGKSLYISDPVSSTLGNITGARVSSQAIDGNGALSPITCDAITGIPISMAMFIP